MYYEWEIGNDLDVETLNFSKLEIVANFSKRIPQDQFVGNKPRLNLKTGV